LTAHGTARRRVPRHAAPALAERTGALLAETGLAIVLCLLTATAWLVATGNPYTPGSTAGYSMGLAGGLMMLALLAYPLRKRMPLLRNAGPLKYWFRAHMVLGLTGPLLILFHSTFRVGSLNAAVALSCMLLVAGSGVIGRFIYMRIHHGLYGSEANLAELREDLARLTEDLRTELVVAPGIPARLAAFADHATQAHGGALRRMARFASLGWTAHRTYRQCRRELESALRKRARQSNMSRHAFEPHSQYALSVIGGYLEAVMRVAQFRGYERLFALWHVAHIPFVYMLAASAVIHVIAVHMY
jgi:hypothetical protein